MASKEVVFDKTFGRTIKGKYKLHYEILKNNRKVKQKSEGVTVNKGDDVFFCLTGKEKNPTFKYGINKDCRD